MTNIIQKSTIQTSTIQKSVNLAVKVGAVVDPLSTAKASEAASNHSLEPVLTRQARQVSLLSSASYTVSLDTNSSPHTYGNKNDLKTQLPSHTVAKFAETINASDVLLNNVKKVEAPEPLLNGSKNILKFIEQRLTGEQASGATSAQLRELLDQGLSGFKQGYFEAEAILGNSRDAVNAAVNQLHSEVMNGFEVLTEKYVTSNDADSIIFAGLVANNNVPAAINSVYIDPPDSDSYNANESAHKSANRVDSTVVEPVKVTFINPKLALYLAVNS